MKNNTKLKAFALIGISAVALIVWQSDSRSNSAEAGYSAVQPQLEQTQAKSVNAAPQQAQTSAAQSSGVPVRNYTSLSMAEYEAKSAYGQQPAKMRGVDIPRLYFDEAGNLILTDNLKYVIEHFLIGASDEGYEQALARIKEYIAMVLPAAAADQALLAVEQYLDYRDQVAEIPRIDEYETDSQALLQQMEIALAAKKQLRRERLPEAMVDSFFGEEERYDDYILVRMKTNSNKALSAQERDSIIAQAELSLPPKTQKRVRYIREEKNLKSNIKDLQAQGNNDAEIYSLRAQFYGEETANRIAYYEDSSDQWLDKVNQFNQNAKTVMQQNVSEQEKQQMIEGLKSSMFSDKEQMKLAVQMIKNRASSIN